MTYIYENVKMKSLTLDTDFKRKTLKENIHNQ